MNKSFKMDLSFFGGEKVFDGSGFENHEEENQYQNENLDENLDEKDDRLSMDIDFGMVDKIVSERAERATRAALKDYFKQLGLSQDETQVAMNQFKKKIANEKPDMEMMQKEASQKLKLGEDAIAQANERLVNAEATIQAAALGVRPERVKHLLKLTDLSNISVDESGKIPLNDIKMAIETVLEDLPELKGMNVLSFGGINPAGQNLTKEQQYLNDIRDAKAQGRLRDVIHLKQQAAKEGLVIF